MVFPASFPQWTRSDVTRSSSAVENVQERRPLIEEVADTAHQEEQGDSLRSFLDGQCVKTYSNNCAFHVFFFLTEDKRIRPLSFTDKLYIMKVSLAFAFFYAVLIFSCKHKINAMLYVLTVH